MLHQTAQFVAGQPRASLWQPGCLLISCRACMMLRAARVIRQQWLLEVFKQYADKVACPAAAAAAEDASSSSGGSSSHNLDGKASSVRHAYDLFRQCASELHADEAASAWTAAQEQEDIHKPHLSPEDLAMLSLLSAEAEEPCWPLPAARLDGVRSACARMAQRAPSDGTSAASPAKRLHIALTATLAPEACMPVADQLFSELLTNQQDGLSTAFSQALQQPALRPDLMASREKANLYRRLEGTNAAWMIREYTQALCSSSGEDINEHWQVHVLLHSLI